MYNICFQIALRSVPTPPGFPLPSTRLVVFLRYPANSELRSPCESTGARGDYGLDKMSKRLCCRRDSDHFADAGLFNRRIPVSRMRDMNISRGEKLEEFITTIARLEVKFSIFVNAFVDVREIIVKTRSHRNLRHYGIEKRTRLIHRRSNISIASILRIAATLTGRSA